MLIKARDVKVNQKKLDTVLDNYNIKKIDYLNIDVEGYELNVLSGFNIKKYNQIWYQLRFTIKVSSFK